MDNTPLVKRLVKDAQYLINVEDYERALMVLHLALEQTRDVDQLTEVAAWLPRIYHRMGQALIGVGKYEEAFECFSLAESKFDRDNVIGRAITLRDHGWAQFRFGDMSEGILLIEEAVRLLEPNPAWDPEIRGEHTVSLGILARTFGPDRTDEARSYYEAVDREVRGGKKWIHELDNLYQLIPLARIQELPGYLLRARQIRLRMLAHYEAAMVWDDLTNGRLVQATFGPALRTTRRLLPF